MSQKYTIVLEQEGSTIIANCLEVDVVSQGKSHGSALDNVREALRLFTKQNPKAKSKQVEIAVVEV